MSMIEPMADRVLVLPDEEKASWDAGGVIEKPEVNREKPQEGTVLAIGPNVKDTRLQPGSKVLYGKFSGSEIKIDGKEAIILLEEEILGKVNPDGGLGAGLTEVLKAKEIAVAEHVRSASGDGCECEPCKAARDAFRPEVAIGKVG